MLEAPQREFSRLLHWPSALLQGTFGSQAGPFGHLSAIIVSPMLKSFKPKAAWSAERLNLEPRSWEPAMLTIASSAIFRVFGFDLKKALWLKAEEPLFTKTFLLNSSPSNSMFQATSLRPTNAAWLRVYASNSRGDFEPAGGAARWRSPLVLSGRGSLLYWPLVERELLTGRLLRRATHAWGSMGEVARGCWVIEALQVVGGAVDWRDTIASIGAVGHLSVPMGQDSWVCLCFGLSFGLYEGGRQ